MTRRRFSEKVMRPILFCTFRMKYYFHREAGERVIDRATVEPQAVHLVCGHLLRLGPAKVRYECDVWECYQCRRLVAFKLPPAVNQAVRALEAARHAAGRCVEACPLCFEAERNGPC